MHWLVVIPICMIVYGLLVFDTIGEITLIVFFIVFFRFSASYLCFMCS